MKINVIESGDRIDKYLASNTTFSRSLITKMIENGFVLVNDLVVKPSYKVKINDEIVFDETYTEKTNINPEKMDLDIVYEDDDIIVLNKPSGLVVHPGNGNYSGTLVNGLMYYTKNLSNVNGNARVGIVHRIDKDTSGLMLVCKTNKAHEILAEDFKNHSVKRSYIALLDGVLPYKSATIDAPIKRDKNIFNMMSVQKDGKKGVTHLEVIKFYKNNTLVKLNLETGRTHQIRVHMKYIGFPVHNDPIYNSNAATEFGQFLHSASLDFIHPITKEKMHFDADLPEEFKNYLGIIDKQG